MQLRTVSRVLMAVGCTVMNVYLVIILHGILMTDQNTPLHKTTECFRYSPTKQKLMASNVENTTMGTNACLYVMDDNHHLIEWLAYHFHTVNLRHLIVTIDPGSLTSPIPIFDRWKNLMDIQIWTEKDFWQPRKNAHKHRHGERRKEDQNTKDFRSRQTSFILRCLKEHKRLNREWTMVIDSDEYLTYNPELSKIKQPGSNRSMWNVRPVEEQGSVASILDQITIPNPYFDDVTTSCVPVVRRQFASIESPDSIIDAMSPPHFDGRSFQTIRWRRYGSNINHYTARTGEICRINDRVPSKAVIDLGRLRLKDLNHPANDGNPHLPLKAICPPNIYMFEEDTPLIAHHYMGTREQFLYRVGDSRGMDFRISKYEYMNSRLGTMESSQVSTWLHGFVESMGYDEASRLLRDVGVLEPVRHLGNTVDEAPLSPHETEEMSLPMYKVGDLVQANYEESGKWYRAEISSVLPHGYYSVVYLDDCDIEIGIRSSSLRRNDTTYDGESDD